MQGMYVKNGQNKIQEERKMTVKKEISGNDHSKNEGKKDHRRQLQNDKMKVKYTFERKKEDVDNLHGIIGILEFYFHKKYNADSKIYRDLPLLTVKLEGILQDLRKANDELTAKLGQLEDLRTSFCRIFKICAIPDDLSQQSQYERMRVIIDVIKILCDKSSDGNATRSDIVHGAGMRGIEFSKVESALDRLKRNGQIYEPIHGKYRIAN